MTDEPPAYVLDSFAILAFLQAEPGGPRVRNLLDQSQRGAVRLLMTVVNLGEVYYKTFKKFGADRAKPVLQLLLDEYEIEFVDVDQDLALDGAQIKARHRMSYADCVAAALAERLGVTMVTGDPEFKAVEDRVKIEWLPQPERA